MTTRKKPVHRRTPAQPRSTHSGHRLRVVLRAYEIPPTAFAEWLRVSPQCLNNWFTRGLPGARLATLARTLSVSKAWLETGESGT